MCHPLPCNYAFQVQNYKKQNAIDRSMRQPSCDRSIKRSGGTIAIAVESSGGTVKVSVCDSGRGLSEQDLLHAFDRFYRSDAARSRESDAPGGAGLGLAIAKALVEAHGGNIWAENASAGGACFRFTLPCAY